MDNEIKYNIHNRFDIEVIDGKTFEVKQKAVAYNTVLDNLWHYIIETTTAFGTCIQYGSGTGTIQPSDTSLFNRANGAGVTQDSLTCDLHNKVITRRSHINLSLSTSVGVNITEVGLAAGTGNGSLTTHAMLQDMNGNPISILKTEFDIINIYATVYCHWVTDDTKVTFCPKSAWQQALTGASNIFGSFTGGYGFSNWAMAAQATWSKTSSNLANKQITYTLPRYDQNTANVDGGLQYLLGSGNFDGLGIKQSSTNAWNSFQITNETIGTGDGIKTGFKTKWSFPYNATVYVNGVPQASGVSVLNKSVQQHDAYVIIIDEDASTDGNLILKPNGAYGEYSSQQVVPPSPFTFYNPFYEDQPIDYIVSSNSNNNQLVYMNAAVSNDLVNWTSIGGSGHWVSSWVDVPAAYQKYKYFRINDGGRRRYSSQIRTQISRNNVIFDTAPADGDVITIDYTTDCIPKDSDHVMDATITLTFGDYTP